ncbi:hypothetical protein B0E53_06978 [Micromonospora sp. MH33]|nr:hypothetical protein B0E53_06978 [Micromonospora sp. MH33]
MGGHPAAGRRGQPDRPAVPAGQPAHHEEPEHLGRGQVEPLPAGEPGVLLGEALLGHADAAVHHGEPGAGVGLLGGHQHPGVRRGEGGRVLHQLGEREHQVAGGGGRRRDPGRDLHVHPGVVLDLAEREPDQVGQRGRRDVPVRAGGTGEHHQAAGVSAQPAGDVVEAVQVLQPPRVGLLPFQPVDQGDLPADQVLRTPADVAEHLRHVAPAGHLPFDQPGGGVLHPLERPGQVADLVPPLRPHVHRVEAYRRNGLHLVVDHPGQLGLGDPGDPVRRAGEPGQRPRHGPGHRHAEQHHAQQDEGGRPADQPGGGERVPLLVPGLGDDVGDDLLLHELAEGDHRADRGEERVQRHRRDRRDRVLDAVDQEGGAGPGGHGGVVQHGQPVLLRCDQLAEPLVVHLERGHAGDVRAGHLRVAGRLDQHDQRGAGTQPLVGTEQRVQRQHLPPGRGAGVHLERQPQRLDQRHVDGAERGHDLVRGGLPGQHGGTQVGQRVYPVEGRPDRRRQ